MIARLRQWLEETHSDTFELVRHFLARFFDTEIGASSGDWQKVAIGIFASLVSLGLLGFQRLSGALPHPAGRRSFPLRNSTRRRSAKTSSACSPSPWRITALLTLLQWQSLFPSLRDYMALTGFPVSARQIFVAKFTALVLLFVAFVLSLTGPLAGFFGWVISRALAGKPIGHRPRQLPRSPPSPAPVPSSSLLCWPCRACCSISCPAAGFCASRTSSRPRCSSSPSARCRSSDASPPAPCGGRPSWFVRLWEAIVTGRPSARPALLAIVLPAAHRGARLSAELSPLPQAAARSPADRAGGQWSGWGSRLLERWIRNPREQAAFAFTWKTLARSRIHRLLLLAYAGLALGWVIKAALDAPTGRPARRGHVRPHGRRVAARARRAHDSGPALPVLAARHLTGQLDVPDRRSGRPRRLAGRRAALRHRLRHRPRISGQPAGLHRHPRLAPRPRGHRARSAGRAALLRTPLPRLAQASLHLFLPPGQRDGLADALPLFRGHDLLRRHSAHAAQRVRRARLLPRALHRAGAVLAAMARQTAWRSGPKTPCSGRRSPETDVMALHLRPVEQDASLTSTPQRAPEMFSAGMVASRGTPVRKPGKRRSPKTAAIPRVLLATFWEDVRYGCRVIRRNPAALPGGGPHPHRRHRHQCQHLHRGQRHDAQAACLQGPRQLRPHRPRNRACRVCPGRPPIRNTCTCATRPAPCANWRRSATSPRSIGDDDPGGSVGIAVSCNFFRVDGLDRAIVGRLHRWRRLRRARARRP